MKYNWACVGCGHIAHKMADAMASMDCTFYSVASRRYEKALDFAREYGIDNVYQSIDDLLCDDSVDIVYIATPHNSHIDYIVKALENGKHVLCEKAITLNSAELDRAVKIAEDRGLILAEAMTIFHCPVYKELAGIIASGKLGPLKTIQVNLGSYKDYDMTNRFFSMDLAGGAMLDIGVYALSFARFFLTESPDEILSVMKKAPTGTDEQVNIILNNSRNEMVNATLSLTAKLPKLGLVAFENGYVSVDNYNRTYKATITYTADESTEVIEDTTGINALAHEVLDMESAVAGGSNQMHLDYTQDVMHIMTKVRYDHNMLYPEEQ